MAIRTQQSLSGFIASDPQLSFTSKGDARLFAKVGQEHYQRNDDGTFTQTDTTFHNLVQFRRAAERSHAQFAKGDAFIAEGYVRTYSHEVDGETRPGEEFVAKKLGHDTARTTYTIDRTHRRTDAVNASQGTDRSVPEATTPATADNGRPVPPLPAPPPHRAPPPHDASIAL